ncbi:ABC transporter permease [Euzebya sp.]|uniref:ABC transporter permease n=1 Tax=Euzebya sp. TaxID=1971409 RepID=UPI0035153FE4
MSVPASASPATDPYRSAWMSLARLAPYRLLGAPAARFVVERNLLLWRGQWVVLVSGVFEPLLYLLVLGVGVGGLVGELTDAAGNPVAYDAFVAPGLLGAAAMNAAVFETYNVYFKISDKLYAAMGATPARPRDIATGEVLWAVLRTGIYAVGFLAVMLALGLVRSPLAVAVLPLAMLVGFAFATTTLAATTFMRTVNDFDLLQIVVVPLFLFSATFYPLEVLPGWAQVVTTLSPLYHGVEALRQVSLGVLDWTLALHLVVLVAVGLAGLAVGARRFEALLRD